MSPAESSPVRSPPADLLWPLARLPEAVREVILRAHAVTVSGDVTKIDANDPPRGNAFARWLRNAARGMGFEGSPNDVPPSFLGDALDAEGAYLIVVHPSGSSEPKGIPVVRSGGDGCVVLRPDGGEWHTRSETLARAVERHAGAIPSIESLFRGLPGGDAAAARLMRAEGIGQAALGVVRYTPDAAHPIAAQLRARGAVGKLVAFGAVTTVQSLAAVGAAWTLGNAALTGVIDLGRVLAWSVLALSDVPLQYVASTILGRLSLDFGEVVKKRLLEGALFVPESDVRRQGFGMHLARLNEASVVEQTSVTEILATIAPLVQVAAAFVLLSKGVLPAALVPLLLLFSGGAFALVVTLRSRYRDWYRARLALTEDLVEKIVGHRTRTVQDNPVGMHESEDRDLSDYARLSARYDDASNVAAIYGRLWLLFAGFALLASFAAGAKTPALLPSAIGIFLAYRGLAALLGVAEHVVTWLSAWEGIRPLFVAGRTRPRPALSTRDGAAGEEGGLDTVVSSLSFAYRQGGRTVLSNASMRIKSGDRILVGGASGGGKTTFSKLLTGELCPTGGTILVDGVDCFSVSESEWRRRIASSPQFHENYVFSNTFGFNVDPTSMDGEMSSEAFDVCRELGLEDLLMKMPSGAAQVVGETGWQLSHGERSRVFIARSLLQGAGLLIFDESFGALDPESLARALECVRRRARTLVVIAHT